nr:glycosyltransferase [uncultured bacterium]
MRLVFVALGVYGAMGGMEQFNRRVLRCLSELGRPLRLDASVIALRDDRPPSGQLPERLRFSGCSRGKVRAVAAFCREVFLSRPDVILYGHILVAPLAAVARFLSPRSRHVLCVHGREAWREPFRDRIPVRERLGARLMDRIVSVSRFTAQKMTVAYGLPEDLFRVLPNAVDVSRGSLEIPLEATPRNGEFRLLSVARLDDGARHKGCDSVIRALAILRRSRKEVHYYIAGGGPLREQFERLAAELGVASSVHFLGYLDDRQLEQTYRSAHAFALPSTGEGFGIVFLEAWKHRLPVVAGNVDASSEVVTHGVNGICVDPRSPEKIAGAIETLVKDPETATRMGLAGHRTVTLQYTHEHFRRRLAEILRECLRRPIEAAT